MADLPEQACKKVNQDQDQEEPEESGVKLNDLPELPFEKIFSYLSLKDRIKSRGVSRRWCQTIDGFRVKRLCFSDRPSGFIYGKNRWVSGAFAQNFINSTKFEQFFQTFGQSILGNLKHLRLCKLNLNAENTPASFVRILNSFGQLEELDLFDIDRSSKLNEKLKFCLNMPMLKSIQIEDGSFKLTLDAPRLQKIKLISWLKLDLVHGESVEKLIIRDLDDMEVAKLKNLKYLYCGRFSSIDSTLLSSLEHLKELHLNGSFVPSDLFEKKKQLGRLNLKIFLYGLHLKGPDDSAIDSIRYNYRNLVYLAEHSSTLADKIPFRNDLEYSGIEAVSPRLAIDLLNRFTDLERITLYKPVQDVDRFLKLLKDLNIKGLKIGSDQSQQLFDRLPDHCALQWLGIDKAPADLDFLLKLNSLIGLDFGFSVHIEFIARMLEELQFLSWFNAEFLNRRFDINIDLHPKQFRVRLGSDETTESDINSVVQWISEIVQQDN